MDRKRFKITQVNKIEIVNVCVKCKAILESKIKYKNATKKCTKCSLKNAEMQNVCKSCWKVEEIVK